MPNISKPAISLPKGIVRDSLIGGAIALGAYILLQFFCALLIDRELLGLEKLYPMVCVAAAVSAFLGCGYSVLRRKEAAILSVSAVVAVFLAVTLAAAFITAETVAVENGLTGVGLSMAAGGLTAAMAGSARPKGKRQRKRRR
ncbi:MAG: hypothetical protein HFF77_01270 [Oscillospiraceae bacterium]|jgi:peptidoglycan/LPS O-acetylase OafA/YrhL|nr:hypothetical protein [Oscillospiraceae bacterium]